MVTPLFINFKSLSEAASRPPVTAMQPEEANSRQRSSVKAFSKRIFVHQEIPVFLLSNSLATSFSSRRRRSLVNKMKTTVSCLSDHLLDPVNQD